jgi:D-amino-acid oxidase
MYTTESHILRRDKDLAQPGVFSALDPLFDRNPWYKDVLPGYRELNQDELIPDHESGCEVTSVCINTAIYLPWLLGQCLKAGVVVRRAILSHINEAKSLSRTGGQRPADIVINTTGLGSLKLGGVADTTMAPARGQIVLVRNESTPMLSTSGTEDGVKEVLYVMQRAAGGGTILGGTYDIGNWESQPDPSTALRIMQRIVEARPEIAGRKGVAGLSVVRHSVGLRPYRKGGVRIEEERLEDGTWVVHNYGHAGWGYQGSYGCAERVVELVDKIQKGKSKL